MFLRFAFLIVMLAVAGCSGNQKRPPVMQDSDREIIQSSSVIGPYSPAVRAGPFLFVSGQIGLEKETGELRDGGIEMETRQALDNLMMILKSAGYDSSDVVSTTVYLRSMNDYQRMNLIYGGYFPDSGFPARSTVAVSDLPRQANIEIAATAYRAR